MNIAFYNNQICERGTTVGLYNYALYNETLLNNKSFIFYDKNNTANNIHVIENFKKRFVVHGTDNFHDIDRLILKYSISHIFIIKGGKNDSKISKIAKNCIQCVFNCTQPHGEIYCSIHESVPGNNGKYPVIPRIISLPNHCDNLRNQLKIPNHVTVFGGYGGKTSFSIPFVHDVVYSVAKRNPDIYFLFANFNPFCLPLFNIIHLPTILNQEEKVKFINTCDCMLWARIDGETFGQAIAEFSIKNKPIVAMKIGYLTHVRTLGNTAFWYSNKEELTSILLNMTPEPLKDWNMFKDYTPEKVMKIFDNVFLKDYPIHLKSSFNIKNNNTMTKLFIPFMSYGGMVHTDYMTSMLVLTKILSESGIDACFSTIKCESLIPRGRNGAVALFMQSDATHILFIDTDLKFDASAVLNMLRADAEVIGGSYPKKSKDNTKYGLSFAQAGEIHPTKIDNIYKASYLPGGFMLIKRSAIKKLQLSNFTRKYKNQLNFYSTVNDTDYHYDLFPCEIVNDIYLSEDYGFCHLCHLEKIPIFLYSDITFTHFANNYPFTGNLEDKIKMEKL